MIPNLDNPITKEREIKALLSASQELKCNNLQIITWEKTGQEKINGQVINYLPLWQFLSNF